MVHALTNREQLTQARKDLEQLVGIRLGRAFSRSEEIAYLELSVLEGRLLGLLGRP